MGILVGGRGRIIAILRDPELVNLVLNHIAWKTSSDEYHEERRDEHDQRVAVHDAGGQGLAMQAERVASHFRKRQ